MSARRGSHSRVHRTTRRNIRHSNQNGLDSTVGTLRDGRLAAQHTYVVITGYVLDLAGLAHVIAIRLDSFPLGCQRFSFRKNSA